MAANQLQRFVQDFLNHLLILLQRFIRYLITVTTKPQTLSFMLGISLTATLLAVTHTFQLNQPLKLLKHLIVFWEVCQTALMIKCNERRENEADMENAGLIVKSITVLNIEHPDLFFFHLQ